MSCRNPRLPTAHAEVRPSARPDRAQVLPMLAHRDALIRRHACRALALSVQHTEGAVERVPRESRKLLVECMLNAGKDVELAATAATLMHVLAKGSNTAATMLCARRTAAARAAHRAAPPALRTAALRSPLLSNTSPCTCGVS